MVFISLQKKPHKTKPEVNNKNNNKNLGYKLLKSKDTVVFIQQFNSTFFE